MTVNAAIKLVEGTSIGTSYSSVYTGISGVNRSRIDAITFVNTSALTSDLSVRLTPSGQVSSDDYLLIDEKTLAAGESYTAPEVEGHSLSLNDDLECKATASVTVIATGTQFT
jgi:hypothetical protein